MRSFAQSLGQAKGTVEAQGGREDRRAGRRQRRARGRSGRQIVEHRLQQADSEYVSKKLNMKIGQKTHVDPNSEKLSKNKESSNQSKIVHQ